MNNDNELFGVLRQKPHFNTRTHSTVFIDHFSLLIQIVTADDQLKITLATSNNRSRVFTE